MYGKWFITLTMVLSYSCNDYLDVAPEGTATLESAFSMRQHTLRYLYTCYSYLPTNSDGYSLDLMGCGDVWTAVDAQSGNKVARGLLTPSNNLMGTWSSYYTAIRDCNNFLEGIETIEVPDLMEFERLQWIAEVKALKAYYHFMLLRQYGPIPIVRENLPVSTDVDGVQVARNTVDETVDYIIELLDEAIDKLPVTVMSEMTDLGRITLPIASFLKAEVLITAASPLYSCNTEFATMKNKDGTQLFPQDESTRIEKWQRAINACSDAMKICMDELGMQLYEYPGDTKYNLTDTILRQMSLRQAFCEDWNNEVIWADTRDWVHSVQLSNLPELIPLYEPSPLQQFHISVPLHIAELYYSEHGIPIEEDSEWDYSTRYTLRRAIKEEALYIRTGGETSRMNFDREPRFYAWLGFAQGIWYGAGSYDDSRPSDLYSHPDIKGFRVRADYVQEPTGYIPKKWIHYQTLQPATNQISSYPYIWPRYRLAELLLFYAEALNEAEDSQNARWEAMKYVDMIRKRAGLKPIEEAWRNYSNNPDKYNTQVGLREIIQQERLIELSLEGKRFWDLRRWKTARVILNKPIQGWSVFNTNNTDIYKPTTLHNQTFGLKDYFWSIADSELTRNTNLVQSLGW